MFSSFQCFLISFIPSKYYAWGSFLEKGIFASGGVRCSQPSRQKNTQHSPANSVSYAG